jgi:hypothetical protein
VRRQTQLRNAANAAVAALRERIQGRGREVFSPVELYPKGQYPHLDPKLTRCEWSHYGQGVKVHVTFSNNRDMRKEQRFERYHEDPAEAVRLVEEAIGAHVVEFRPVYQQQLRHAAHHAREVALAEFVRADALEAQAAALDNPDAATVQAGDEAYMKSPLELFEELEKADSEASAAGAYEIETPERKAEVTTKILRAKVARQNLRRALARHGTGR